MNINQTIINLQDMLDELLVIHQQLKHSVSAEHSNLCECCQTMSWSQEAKTVYQISKQVSAARRQIFKVLEFLQVSVSDDANGREHPRMDAEAFPWQIHDEPTFKEYKDTLGKKLQGNWETQQVVRRND